jgi:methionyl-tRNA formyltransferase
MSSPTIVVLGMPCLGTVPPLRALLAAGFEVRAVLLATRRAERPVVGDVAAIARAATVPVIPIGSMVAGREPIARLAPDLLVAACFPWRVPPELLAVPRLGALNVHPSLLPVGRGPEPVFWTLRRGERQSGATVHLMDAGFDTGPIVAQGAVEVPVGIRAPDLERELMTLGGELLVEAIENARRRTGPLTGQPQPVAGGTSAPVPGADDFVIPTNLPGRWAYSFGRGVAPLGGPLRLLVMGTGEVIPVRDAIDDDPLATQAAPLVDEGDGIVRVRFNPGVVRFRRR